MGEVTTIEWTNSTWNPWRGCDKVSPGCLGAQCYMFRDQLRYGRDPSVVVRCADSTFYAPLRSKKWKAERDRHLAEKGSHHVFTCSWSDFFHEDADPWRDEAWDVIRQTPESTYQILTKRPERISDHLPPDWGAGWPNVWLGVSIENRRFVGRADLLRDVPAAVRFISAEPLLGPLMYPEREYKVGGRWAAPIGCWADGSDAPELDLTDIAWLIVGGESGGPTRRRLVDERNQPRVDRLKWVRDLRDAAQAPLLVCCGALGHSGQRDGLTSCCGQPDSDGPRAAFLFKQWGGSLPTSGGRLLDGRTWDEMPVAEHTDTTGCPA